MVHCVHHLFEQQVQKSPQKLAIECPQDGTRLSYAVLNRRANQYARYFRSQGIGPGSLVAVFLSNTAERIVTLLAIHKAGAGYVLLDPDYPAHLATTLKSISLALVVTQERFLARFPDQLGPIVCLDTLTDVLLRQAVDNLESTASPEDVAYVAFTSGSTGCPKAVAIPHRASVNHISSVVKAYELMSDDRVLLTASPSFDMTNEDIFPTITCGATLVLLPNVVLSGVPYQPPG